MGRVAGLTPQIGVCVDEEATAELQRLANASSPAEGELLVEDVENDEDLGPGAPTGTGWGFDALALGAPVLALAVAYYRQTDLRFAGSALRGRAAYLLWRRARPERSRSPARRSPRSPARRDQAAAQPAQPTAEDLVNAANGASFVAELGTLAMTSVFMCIINSFSINEHTADYALLADLQNGMLATLGHLYASLATRCTLRLQSSLRALDVPERLHNAVFSQATGSQSVDFGEARAHVRYVAQIQLGVATQFVLANALRVSAGGTSAGAPLLVATSFAARGLALSASTSYDAHRRAGGRFMFALQRCPACSPRPRA